jgi:uncharacterized protein (TIGR02246 family)
MSKKSLLAGLVPAALGALLGYGVAVSGGGKPASRLVAALQAGEKGGPQAKPAKQEDSAAQAGASRNADEQAIRQAAADYAKAYKKADADALLAFWDADAEFIDEAGKITRGRKAIGAVLRKHRSALLGVDLKLDFKSIRFLTPEVATADADAVVRNVDGSTDASPFAAVLIKKGGRWLLSSVRDLPEQSDPEPAPPYEQLKQLEWMIGEWHDTNLDTEVHLSCRWDDNQSFIMQHYTVKQKDESFKLTQRIGWDPTSEQIRCWFFDSLGGFGEGIWMREGNQWVVEVEGVLLNGENGTSRNIWRYVDENKFVWQAKDRAVEGRPLPDVEVKFARRTEKP